MDIESSQYGRPGWSYHHTLNTHLCLSKCPISGTFLSALVHTILFPDSLTLNVVLRSPRNGPKPGSPKLLRRFLPSASLLGSICTITNSDSLTRFTSQSVASVFMHSTLLLPPSSEPGIPQLDTLSSWRYLGIFPFVLPTSSVSLFYLPLVYCIDIICGSLPPSLPY